MQGLFLKILAALVVSSGQTQLQYASQRSISLLRICIDVVGAKGQRMAWDKPSRGGALVSKQASASAHEKRPLYVRVWNNSHGAQGARHVAAGQHSEAGC